MSNGLAMRRRVIVIIALGALIVCPNVVFGQSQAQKSQNTEVQKITEQIRSQVKDVLDKQLTSEKTKAIISEGVDDYLDTRVNNVIYAYERTARKFDWFLIVVGLFLGTLVLFTIGHGAYLVLQTRKQLKETEGYKDKAQEYASEMEKMKKEFEKVIKPK